MTYPPGRRGSPLLVPAAALVLLVAAVVGLLLTWVEITMDVTVLGQRIHFSSTANGFGLSTLTEDYTGASETTVSGKYLFFAVVAMVLLVTGGLLATVRTLSAVAVAVPFILSGAVFMLSGVIGLVSDDRSGVRDGAVGAAGPNPTAARQQLITDMLDGTEVSKGPGQYIGLVVGVLVVALGLLCLARSRSRDVPQAPVPWTHPGYPGQYGRQPSPGQPAWPTRQSQPTSPPWLQGP